MPRSTTKRKDQTAIQPESRVGPQEMRVAQTQRLYGGRANTRGINQFINNLGQFAARENRKEEMELGVQGEADALAGTVNDELMGKEAYATAVNTAMGGSDGLTTRVRLREEAKRAVALAHSEGIEWDPNEWWEESTAELRNSPQFQDPYYARAAGRQLETLRGELGMLAEDSRNEAELEQGLTAIQSLTFAQLLAGDYDPEVTATYGDVIGIPRKEIDIARAKGAISLLGQVERPEQLEAVKKYYDGLSTAQKAVIGDDIKTAFGEARRRLSAGMRKEATLISEAQTRRVAEIDQKIDKGEFTYADLMAHIEQNPDDFSEGEFKTRAQKIADKSLEMEAEAVAEGEYVAALQDPSKAYGRNFDFDGFKDYYEKVTNEVGDNVMSVVAQFNNPNGDPVAAREELFGILSNERWRIQGGTKHGIIPPFIKRALSPAVTLTNPDAIPGAAELQMALKETFGEGILADVPDEAVANLEAYNSFIADGMTSQAALDALTRSHNGRDFSRSRKYILNNEAFDDAIADFEEHPSLFAASDSIRDLASYKYMLTGKAEESVEWAVNRYKSTHVELDGYMVPKSGLGDNFVPSYEANKEYFQEYLRESGMIPEEGGFKLVPTVSTSKTGQFMYMSGGLPVTDDNGVPIVNTTAELMDQFAILEQARIAEEDAAALERAQKNSAIDAASDRLPNGADTGPLGMRFMTPKDAPTKLPELPEIDLTLPKVENHIYDGAFEFSDRYSNKNLMKRFFDKVDERPLQRVAVEEISKKYPTFKDGIATLIEHEGYRSVVYMDSTEKGATEDLNKESPTVGFGHKVLPEDNLKVGDEITQEQAIEFLEKDIEKAIEGAKALPVDFENLPSNVQIGLINMVYQMGGAGVSKFAQTLQYIRDAEYDKAADEALDSRWARQTPNRARKVTNLFRS